MKFDALSPAFDGVHVLIHEACTDDHVYREGFGDDEGKVVQGITEAGSNEHHTVKSQGSPACISKTWYGFVFHEVSFPAVEERTFPYQIRSGASIEYGGEWS